MFAEILLSTKECSKSWRYHSECSIVSNVGRTLRKTKKYTLPKTWKMSIRVSRKRRKV